MNRCTKNPFSVRRACALVLLTLGAGLGLGAGAQGAPRNFSAQVQFGEMSVTQFPVVEINGQQMRTTPGFRLLGPENTQVQASGYQGAKLPVAYLLEPQTRWLHQAWILTPAEAEKYKK